MSAIGEFGLRQRREGMANLTIVQTPIEFLDSDNPTEFGHAVRVHAVQVPKAQELAAIFAQQVKSVDFAGGFGHDVNRPRGRHISEESLDVESEVVHNHDRDIAAVLALLDKAAQCHDGIALRAGENVFGLPWHVLQRMGVECKSVQIRERAVSQIGGLRIKRSHYAHGLWRFLGAFTGHIPRLPSSLLLRR